MNDRTNLPVPVPPEGSRSLTLSEAGAGLALTGAVVVAGLGLRLLSRGIRALVSTPSSTLTVQARRLLRRGSEARVDAEPNFWIHGWRRSYTRWSDGSSRVQVEEVHHRGRL